MKAHFEISYFPMMEDYKSEIKSFITKMNKKLENCEIITGKTSSTVTGDYDEVMQFLYKEMGKRLQKEGKQVFSFKVISK